MDFKILLTILFLYTANSYHGDGPLMVLFDSDFPKVLQDFQQIIILFYAPWSNHCKVFIPIFQKLADTINEEGLKVVLAKVDGTVQEQIREKLEIRNYPKIILFDHGQRFDYEGGRTIDEMLGWVHKKMQGPVLKINKQFYDGLEGSNNVSIVFHGQMKSQLGKLFYKIALSDHYNNYYFSQKQSDKQEEIEIFRPFGDKLTFLKPYSQLKQWIKNNQRPLIKPFDQRTIQQIFSQGKASLCLFNPGQSAEVKQIFASTAQIYQQSLPNHLLFTELDVLRQLLQQKNTYYSQLAQYLKLDSKLYLLVIIESKNKAKFVKILNQSHQLTRNTINQFIQSWSNQSAQRYGLTEKVDNIITNDALQL